MRIVLEWPMWRVFFLWKACLVLDSIGCGTNCASVRISYVEGDYYFKNRTNTMSAHFLLTDYLLVQYKTVYLRWLEDSLIFNCTRRNCFWYATKNLDGIWFHFIKRNFQEYNRYTDKLCLHTCFLALLSTLVRIGWGYFVLDKKREKNELRRKLIPFSAYDCYVVVVRPNKR